MESRPGVPPPHEPSAPDPHRYLSPHHASIPIPQVQTQPVLPRRAESPPLPVRMTGGGGVGGGSSNRRRSGTVSSSGGGRGGGGEIPTEPNSPVIPPVDAQSLPPGFVAQTFTPHSAPAPSLPQVSGGTPDIGSSLPPGFIPHTITDTVTGVVTPLTGMTSLPSIGAPGPSGNGGSTSRRQSMYGNPNTTEGDQEEGEGGGGGAPDWGSSGWNVGGSKPSGGIYSPYTSSSTPIPTGPPVIPRGTYGDTDETGGGGGGPGSSRTTPSQRARSIYGGGTPGGSTRGLPGGTPAGGGVYQNPLRQEEGDDGDGDNDDLLARNTKINATTPAPAKAKKKKRR